MKPVLSILVSMMTTHFSLAKMCRYDISIGSLKVVDQGISPDVYRSLAQLLLMKPVLSILVSMMTTHFSLAKMCHYDISIGSRLLWIFYVFVLSCVCNVLSASVYMCFVVTCWERADLLALVCGVFCEFVTFPLVSWVRCGT